jgi:hypothetical protein
VVEAAEAVAEPEVVGAEEEEAAEEEAAEAAEEAAAEDPHPLQPLWQPDTPQTVGSKGIPQRCLLAIGVKVINS